MLLLAAPVKYILECGDDKYKTGSSYNVTNTCKTVVDQRLGSLTACVVQQIDGKNTRYGMCTKSYTGKFKGVDSIYGNAGGFSPQNVSKPFHAFYSLTPNYSGFISGSLPAAE